MHLVQIEPGLDTAQDDNRQVSIPHSKNRPRLDYTRPRPQLMQISSKDPQDFRGGALEEDLCLRKYSLAHPRIWVVEDGGKEGRKNSVARRRKTTLGRLETNLFTTVDAKNCSYRNLQASVWNEHMAWKAGFRCCRWGGGVMHTRCCFFVFV